MHWLVMKLKSAKGSNGAKNVKGLSDFEWVKVKVNKETAEVREKT